jgi:hypothetical protein
MRSHLLHLPSQPPAQRPSPLSLGASPLNCPALCAAAGSTHSPGQRWRDCPPSPPARASRLQPAAACAAAQLAQRRAISPITGPLSTHRTADGARPPAPTARAPSTSARQQQRAPLPARAHHPGKRCSAPPAAARPAPALNPPPTPALRLRGPRLLPPGAGAQATRPLLAPALPHPYTRACARRCRAAKAGPPPRERPPSAFLHTRAHARAPLPGSKGRPLLAQAHLLCQHGLVVADGAPPGLDSLVGALPDLLGHLGWWWGEVGGW